MAVWKETAQIVLSFLVKEKKRHSDLNQIPVPFSLFLIKIKFFYSLNWHFFTSP